MKSVLNYVLQQSQEADGWPDDSGTLLPSCGHKLSSKFSPNLKITELTDCDTLMGLILASFGSLDKLLAL